MAMLLIRWPTTSPASVASAAALEILLATQRVILPGQHYLEFLSLLIAIGPFLRLDQLMLI